MTPSRNCSLLSVLAVLLSSGCAGPHPAVLTPAPVAIAPVPPGSVLPPEADRTPVYRNPQIGKIYLRAHEDASGRLVGPQVIYQIVEPGGWNVAALDHGEPRAADPRLREGAPTVIDPTAGWMLEPAKAPADASQSPPPEPVSGTSSQPTALK